MLTKSQVAEFNINGFINGGKVLDDDQIDALRSEIERVIAEKDNPNIPQPVLIRNLAANDSAPVWQIVNIWEASPPFKALLSHPKIVAGITQLTEATTLRVWHDQIQYKPPEIGGVNMWHQDAPLWPIIAPMTEVTAWVALDNADETNGCMSMVPGSHLWGNTIDFLHTLEHYEAIPAEYNGQEVKIVRCPVEQGEVHFHHALTWHGSHANTSGRPRRAIALHYMTQETRYVASGKHVMKQFVDVANGDLLEGEHFPVVYQSSRA